MPFLPTLSSEISARLRIFAQDNDFSSLYKSYSWKDDEISSGFKDILGLELRLTNGDQSTGITLDDVRAVAKWGAMPNQKNIAGDHVVLLPNSLHTENGTPQPTLQEAPTLPIGLLLSRITKGVGPTYLTKILRFILPQEYGALDSRCVRVFGKGDITDHKFNWLKLKAQKSGTRWSIPATQREWPSDYGVWINILRYFASILPRNCPHPTAFYERSLRRRGAWECADVEMALFAYASRQIK